MYFKEKIEKFSDTEKSFWNTYYIIFILIIFFIIILLFWLHKNKKN
jgi:hypothetical protein